MSRNARSRRFKKRHGVGSARWTERSRKFHEHVRYPDSTMRLAAMYEAAWTMYEAAWIVPSSANMNGEDDMRLRRLRYNHLSIGAPKRED